MPRLQLPSDGFERFRAHLDEQGFSFENKPNQLFLARGPGAVVSLYTNGTVFISGGNVVLVRGLCDFAISIGAQEVTKNRELGALDVAFPHAGTDEVGKGDYFGPLVIAGALVPSDKVDSLKLLGVKDSKLLSDTSVRHLASQIRRQLGRNRIKVVPISPTTYNKLYDQMRNVNRILGWGHARAIEDLLINAEPFDLAVADQFGDPGYIEEKLMAKGKQIELVQVTKAERDIAVAAASILARDEFLRIREEMSQRYNIIFPKGATDVVPFGKKFVEEYGIDALVDVAKLHFSTTSQITGGPIPSVKEEAGKPPEEQAHREPMAPRLISKGEGASIEFKSWLRWNEKAQKTDRDLEWAVLKTMAAFLNTDGGTLLIGVADDKSVHGLEKDGFPNNDKYLLHLWNLVNTHMGRDLGTYVHTDFERVEGKQVLVVSCRKSPKPIYLRQERGEEEFYVRTGPGSTKLGLSEAHEYIKRHFGSLTTYIAREEDH
jgi:ribonuclease HIII